MVCLTKKPDRAQSLSLMEAQGKAEK